MHENIKREEAICYGKQAYLEMIEVEEPKEYTSEGDAFIEAAFYLGRYDQEHVNVAIWWQDETVTIHCGMPNDIYDIFLRLDGSLDCPVFAKGIRVTTCLLNSNDQNSDCMHTFSIWVNKPESEKYWTDPRVFFLKDADKEIWFDSAAQQEVNQ